MKRLELYGIKRFGKVKLSQIKHKSSNNLHWRHVEMIVEGRTVTQKS